MTHAASSRVSEGGGKGAGLAGTAQLVCTESYGLDAAVLQSSTLAWI